MEFVPGQSLDRYLAKQGPLSVQQACDFMQQAAAGLNNAFKQGMVHRDLKPQNLMLTPEGKIKILDFGLAKLASEQRQRGWPNARERADGDADYLAPEQALDAAKADIRADIYSLGCTLYCLLAGAPPFMDDTEMKVLLAHQHDDALPAIGSASRHAARTIGVGRPDAGENPGRPATDAGRGGSALAPFIKGTGTATARAPKPPRHRRRRLSRRTWQRSKCR